MTDLERNALRKRMRSKRRGISPAERRSAAEALAQRLATHPLFLRSRHVTCYWPADGEIDPQPLMRRALSMGKTVYLPVLAPNGTSRLWFAPYREGDVLLHNRFNIPEPAVSPSQHARLTALDLVLAPLVAFDPQGNRLGMGGGFYDRTFAYLKHRVHWQKPRLLGLAYEFQKVDALPHQPWDVPLYGIATERQIYLND